MSSKVARVGQAGPFLNQGAMGVASAGLAQQSPVVASFLPLSRDSPSEWGGLSPSRLGGKGKTRRHWNNLNTYPWSFALVGWVSIRPEENGISAMRTWFEKTFILEIVDIFPRVQFHHS